MFAHLLAIAVTTLVLVWLLHFRGGLAFESANKGEILNGWGGSRLKLRKLVIPTRLLSYGIIIYLFGQPPNKSNGIKQPLMYYKIEFHWFDLPIKAMNFQAPQFHS
ncbi:hypothetical protein NC652_021503 [Populus alba x Populus x berolinensis]|nr:hypothetical protein NC652_021503 [Populus alba x Populus x berolinensis]